METIKLDSNDLLIIDPCYIKHIKDDRFDSLRCVKTIHEGDDGEYDVYVADKIRNSDCYCSIDPENMGYYIQEELKNN